MLARFSLYGFLKNQQYYEPFIILAFREEKGLSFAVIGLLIGFRELCVNILEIPTGTIADLCGRRRSMVLAFVGYIISFAVFASSSVLWHLFLAMFFFAIGEAFRTGTHKAMILDWLRLEGRESEKTEVYGYTRSWSKVGSALSAIIAAALVCTTGRYSDVFWFAIVPYILGIINFLGYPAELEGRAEQKASLRAILRHLVASIGQVVRLPRLRRVLAESMGYESAVKVAGDYLQPLLRQAALALPVLVALKGERRTAILVGALYCILNIVSSVAARRSHAVAGRLGGEPRAASKLWQLTFGVFACLTVALLTDTIFPAIALFVVLEVVRNIWRPIAIARLDNETEAGRGATMLSIESQSKAFGTMLLAPAVGFAVDHFAMGPEAPAFWVFASAGVVIAACGAIVPAMAPATPSDRSETTAPRT